MDWVWDKVVVGGIVVFDDYGHFSSPGIAQLVEEQRSKKDRIVVQNLNGHAVMIKIA